MYLPRHFDERRPELLAALLREQPLGWLVTPQTGGLQADPVPWLHEPGADGAPGALLGHVARANPLWRETPAGAEVLVLFQGPHAYVSPNWYPSKAEQGKAVPTWNYQALQVRGRLQVQDDPAAARAIVTRLTRVHEAAQPAPWAVDDAPADYLAAMLKAIVAVRVEITAWDGKWKLSQNRSPADIAGAVAGLQGLGEPEADALARQMAAAAAPTVKD